MLLMEKFEEQYKRLNKAQKQAVNTIDGPVLVIAGPGTGKTQLLSMRAANILKNTDADPKNILCLTFTNKAAANMRERLNQLIGPSSRGIKVKTFHSFATEVMNEYPDYFWHGARLSTAPDAVQDDIIQTILSGLPLDNPLSSTFFGSYTALHDVKQALKLAKEAGLTPDELRKVIKQNLEYIDKIESKLIDLLSPSLSSKNLPKLLKDISKLPEQKTSQKLILPLNEVLYDSLEQAVTQDEPTGRTKQTGKWKTRWIQTVAGKKGMFSERKRNEWWLHVADAYEMYRQHLHQRGYYDYSDMLIEVIEQLNKEPGMLADLQERYWYVMIDEFQDTNAAQLRLAHLITDHYSANNKPNFMAVGDDDQSIFAFNGAELNNVLSFTRSYPDAKLIVLKDNYRSNQDIIKLAESIIDQAEDRLVNRDKSLTKHLLAKNPPKKQAKIIHKSYPTREHQYYELAKDICKLWQSGERDVAILARKHDSLVQLANILTSMKVPINYERQNNILEQEAAAQVNLIASIAVAIAEGDKQSVDIGISKLVRQPMWQVSPKSLWQLATDNYSKPDWLKTLLDSRDEKLQALGNWLTWLARISETQPLPLIMEYIVGLEEGQYLRSPLRDYYLKADQLSANYLEAISSLRILLNVAQEFAAQNPHLSDYVRFVDLHLTTGRVIANESWFTSGSQAVQLLTVHKAKGLEFEHVFIVDAIEPMWRPRVSGRKSPANLLLQSYGESEDDYVRLLYVAATRAKRSLIASSYFDDDQGNTVLPTPLLSHVKSETVENPKSNPIEVLENNIRWPNLNTHDEKALLKDTLENFELSPTALINFLDISEAGPISFKERNLLRLPRLHSPEGKYGTAIHAALETAQRLINTRKLEIDTVFDRFDASLDESNLLPNDNMRYKTRGHKLLTDLLKGNEDFLQKGSLAEQRISDIFIGKAKIKGTIDRIDFNDSKLIIGDYKTGSPLSSFDTKDKNKSLKAWRHKTQLLFYTLLVQNSPRFSQTDISTQMIYVESDNMAQIKLQFNPSPEELARLKNLIQKVWQHVQALDFPDVSKYPQTIEGIVQFEDDLLSGKI